MVDISVIIPIYGVEKYIEKCLRSLFAQTKTDGVEFILVNDCTKDKSMEIVDTVLFSFSDLDVRIINKEQNEGLAAARQSGMDIARGEYVMHIDSDDWVEPTMLEDMFRKAQETTPDIVIVDYLIEYSFKTHYVKCGIETSDQLVALKNLVSGCESCSLCNKMIKRSLYVDNNIRGKKGLNMFEDFFITAKLFVVAKKIDYINNAYYHYFCSNTESITKTFSQIFINNLFEVMDNVEIYLREKKHIDIVEHEFSFKKIEMKFNLLVRSEGKSQKSYASIYPEVTKLIFKHPNMSMTWKIYTYLASIGLLILANKFKKLVIVVKKIVRRSI